MTNKTTNTKDKFTVKRKYTKDKSFELCLISIIKKIAQDSEKQPYTSEETLYIIK